MLNWTNHPAVDPGRSARRGGRLESILADLRFGVRHVSRTPYATLTMIVVLALGIGFNAAVFVVLHSLASSPPPGMTRQEGLVRIRGIDRRSPGYVVGREFPYPEYREYAAQQSLFSAAAAWTSSDVALDVGRTEENLQSAAATYVTARYFQVLGVRPILGTGLPADDVTDAAAPQLAAVISHVVWDRYYGRDPDVVGRTMKVNDVTVTIVGVAPRLFAGARSGGSQVRVWLPLNARRLVQRPASALADHDEAVFGIVARLQPGLQVDQTLPTVQAIAARAAQRTTRGPASGARSTDVAELLGINYFPESGETPSLIGRATTLMIPLFILLITCTNVSTLLAGLAVSRRREIAVRLSLGAPRRRIVRQLVTESVLLALAAGALALFVVWVLLRTFDSSVTDFHLMLDWRTLVFTAGFAIATGIVFGISPALHATRLSLSDVLKGSAGALAATRSRLQSGLVVAQIAFAQPALLGMGALLLQMTADFRELPAPIFADRILDVRFNTNPRYGRIDQAREDTLRRLQVRLAAVPGVEAVVAQESADDYFTVAVLPTDRAAGPDAGMHLTVRAQAAPSGYYSLMGIPIVQGRDFDAPGREDPGAIVIGADLARRLWGPADPVGRRFTTAGPNPRNASLLTVVGVVDEARAGLSSRGDDEVHRIFVPDVRVTSHFLVRTRGPAGAAIPVIRSVANIEAPDLPIVSSRTLAAIEAGRRSSIVNAITAIGSTGLLALFLSAIGLYAVVACAVGQRVREIGIRTALGAGDRQVVRLFLFRGLRLSLVGLGVGLTLSVAVVRLMAVVRGEEAPAGTVGLAALVACAVIGVALLATWIPARRAARVDPLDALRVE